MRVVRGLSLVLAAAATLGMVCALTWTSREASIFPTPGSQAQAPWQTAETSHASAPPEVVVLAPRGGFALPQTWAPPSSDRLPLAVRLQRELARVGCYDGEINGIWTPATRRALKAFMDRVNAALPTEAPDRIQLLLVEAARERVCGAACPAGETLAEGRCVPNVVLAARKSAPNALPTDARADQGPASAAAGPMPPLAGDASGLSTPPPPAARAAEARRRRGGQPSFFGLAIFKQIQKLGF
jgi:peptidoglycan hydrolase-like protein with peptidoglycan-binding domain